MTAPFLFLLLRRQRALRESMALPCSAPRGILQGRVAPAPPDARRGFAPPGASRQTWLLPPCVGALRPSTPGVCEGLAAPTPPDLGAPPQTPGDFPVAGKVTKGAPGAAPLDLPVQGFRPCCARCASRRAGFCHRKRPICHFEMVGESVLLFPLAPSREHFVLLIRGSAGFWLHVWMQLLGRFGV